MMPLCEPSAKAPSAWMNWCRLCAKRSEFGQEHEMIFSKDVNSALTTSIGKYFWVNIKPEDEIPKSLCRECRVLIDELVEFTERINKVQSMYCILQNLKHTTVDAEDQLRAQFGIGDESWKHIIKANHKTPMPEVATREAQTDLVIFFNRNLINKENIENNKGFAMEEQQKCSPVHQQQEFEEIVDEMEYILNDENDECDVSTLNYTEDSEHIKINSVATVKDEDVDIEDSDLFKELKFKTEDTNMESLKIVSRIEKQATEEVHQVYDVSDSDMPDLLSQDPEEADDEEDFIEILDFKTLEDYSTLTQRKRGRPRKSKQDENSSESSYRYDCSPCKRKYKNPTVYRKHMLNHHGVAVGQLPAFVCNVCGHDCLTDSALKKHMRKHLPDEEKFTIPCPFCEKKFAHIAAMKQHVNGVHHQIKPFICDQCGRACTTLAALNEHQLVHTNECPFICEVCKKAFKNKARLKAHMDTHTESEYTCPDCNLKLNTKRTLLQHRLVHSNEKRFKCHFCDAAFKRSKSLKNHLILHTGLRPYKCPFCEKSFSNGSNCRSHKKKVHPKELAEEEALGKKCEPATVPKLEDLKAAKGIVQPRKFKRHTEDSLSAEERIKKELGEDADDLSMEDNYEVSDVQYEIEGELDDNDDLEGDSQDFVDNGEETVIYEIIGEV